MMLSDDIILKVSHLKQYFKSTKAVDDISFSIKRGEVFGIVGESGCGKTTTGRSIIKLYEPTGGNIWFDGMRIATGIPDMKTQIQEAKKDKDLKKANELSAELAKNLREIEDAKKAKIMNKMQMIFQDPIASLNPRMTVREIIAEGLIIQGIKDKNVIQKAVHESLTKVGLVSEHAERYPHEFSGGQRQRIGIARAIILKPDLIIADEPLSALDVSIQAQVINLLNDIREQMQLTILFIAHDLAVVKYFSDRIAVMYYGKIVELAESQELFKNPLHPYTRALLSAMPLPDPRYEKRRKRIRYVPALDHDYSNEQPVLTEILPGHFVSANTAELQKYAKEIEARK